MDPVERHLIAGLQIEAVGKDRGQVEGLNVHERRAGRRRKVERAAIRQYGREDTEVDLLLGRQGRDDVLDLDVVVVDRCAEPCQTGWVRQHDTRLEVLRHFRLEVRVADRVLNDGERAVVERLSESGRVVASAPQTAPRGSAHARPAIQPRVSAEAHTESPRPHRFSSYTPCPKSNSRSSGPPAFILALPSEGESMNGTLVSRNASFTWY